MDEARVSIHIAAQLGSLSVFSPGILSVCIMNVSGMHISDTSYVLNRTVASSSDKLKRGDQFEPGGYSSGGLCGFPSAWGATDAMSGSASKKRTLLQ
jgi:hypothetical protein